MQGSWGARGQGREFLSAPLPPCALLLLLNIQNLAPFVERINSIFPAEGEEFLIA